MEPGSPTRTISMESFLNLKLDGGVSSMNAISMVGVKTEEYGRIQYSENTGLASCVWELVWVQEPLCPQLGMNGRQSRGVCRADAQA